MSFVFQSLASVRRKKGCWCRSCAGKWPKIWSDACQCGMFPLSLFFSYTLESAISMTWVTTHEAGFLDRWSLVNYSIYLLGIKRRQVSVWGKWWAPWLLLWIGILVSQKVNGWWSLCVSDVEWWMDGFEVDGICFVVTQYLDNIRSYKNGLEVNDSVRGK